VKDHKLITIINGKQITGICPTTASSGKEEKNRQFFSRNIRWLYIHTYTFWSNLVSLIDEISYSIAIFVRSSVIYSVFCCVVAFNNNNNNNNRMKLGVLL
jgi:hypothetical protein